MSGADRVGQRGVERVIRGDPEQLARRVVDDVRQLLGFLVGKQAERLEAKLLLDRGDGGEMTEDDQGHAVRIDEIRAGSKVKDQRIHRFTSAVAGLALRSFNVSSRASARRVHRCWFRAPPHLLQHSR